MAAVPALTYASLCQSIKKSALSPVYLLHGEESYYLDELMKLFEETVPAEERAFNLYVLYGHGTSSAEVLDACRRFPVMADRQLVLLKEAQSMNANEVNKLAEYVRHPNPTTTLVLCFRGAAAKGKDLIGACKTSAVVFESRKLTDRNIGPVLEGLIREVGLNIEPKGLSMLKEYVGTDLAKLHNEINKMALVLGKGAMITPESIERNIGVSKDYNNFELIDALAVRDAAKAFTITRYFRSNPKNNPGTLTAAALFGFFSSLMIMHFTRDKSPSSLMGALGLKWQSQLSRYETGARNYNAYRTIEIISAIRDFDRKSKGVGSRLNEYDLLDELIFRILAARGDLGV